MLTTPALTAPASNPTASGLLRRATPDFETTLSAAIDVATSTIPLSLVTGLSTDSAVTIVIDPDTVKEETIIGFPESTNLVNAVRHVEGATVAHDNGAIVMMYATAIDYNSLIDFLREEHNPDGTHGDITVHSILIGGLALQAVAMPTGSVVPFAAAAAPAGFNLCDGSAISRTTYAALFAVIGTTFGVGDGSTTFNLPDLRSRSVVGAGAGTFATTFAATDAVVATDVITVPSNSSLYTGTAVVLTAGTTAPTGLTSGATYYVIRLTATTIKLASTLANAVAGTAIDITAQGAGTNTLTVTYTNNALGAKAGEETHANTISETPAHTHTFNTNVGVDNNHNYTGTGFNPISNDVSGITINPTGGSAAHNNLPPLLALNYIIKT